MALHDVDYEHLLQAMEIIDEIGPDAARQQRNAAILRRERGFQRANTIYLIHVGREDRIYEHRVLIALAHALQYPAHDPLCPRDFHRFNFREFILAINNEVGPRIGWQFIHPDTEAEAAFAAAFA